MSPAVFFTKFIQIGVSELNRYKWWTLGIPREQKLYWFLPKQLPHDLPPQTVVPRSLWSPMSPPPSWWIGTWSFIPHMFQSLLGRQSRSYPHMVRSQGPPLRRLTLETSQLGIYAQPSIYLLSPPQRWLSRRSRGQQPETSPTSPTSTSNCCTNYTRSVL